MQNEIRFIDLFGGCGGFRLGLEKASMEEDPHHEGSFGSPTLGNAIQWVEA